MRLAPRPVRACGIVQRPQEPRLSLDEHEGFALIPGMVAERDGVGARREDLVADRLGDPEAAGRVLAVDDDAVEPPPLAERGRRSITTLRPAGPRCRREKADA